MECYLAPMEGLTGYVFRNASHKFYPHINKYFAPFIAGTSLNYKERNDILPEHNEGIELVPQILTNKAADFLEITGTLKDFGYTCVNLNLGCPSGTVTAKKKGAGFLAFPQELDRFLDEIFMASPLKISVKTRIGKEDYREWEQLQEIFWKYPMEELILHPRLQKDYYKNSPNREIYGKAAATAPFPVCYNGDIHSKEDFLSFYKQFPDTDKIMLGRGVLKNLGLAGELKDYSEEDSSGKEKDTDWEKLLAFHNEIMYGYCKIMSGDANTLYKMKELWTYLGGGFGNADKWLKKIRKAGTLTEYQIAVQNLFREQNDNLTLTEP